MSTSAATSTPAPLPALPASQLPTVQIPVPAGTTLDADLAKALAKGAKAATTFRRTHTAKDDYKFIAWAGDQLPFPPNTGQDTKELAELHAEADTRTPELTQAAQWYASNTFGMWGRFLKQYDAHVSPKQAAAAEKLLEDVEAEVDQETDVTKSAMLRTRPFVEDPTLTLAVNRPGNNPSYPSGHSSYAFASAIVLSMLMPDRAKEFMSLAQQIAYSRIYGGVHFPSDVVAGAQLGSTIADYLAYEAVANGEVAQVRGTAAPHKKQ